MLQPLVTSGGRQETKCWYWNARRSMPTTLCMCCVRWWHVKGGIRIFKRTADWVSPPNDDDKNTKNRCYGTEAFFRRYVYFASHKSYTKTYRHFPKRTLILLAVRQLLLVAFLARNRRRARFNFGSTIVFSFYFPRWREEWRHCILTYVTADIVTSHDRK